MGGIVWALRAGVGVGACGTAGNARLRVRTRACGRAGSGAWTRARAHARARVRTLVVVHMHLRRQAAAPLEGAAPGAGGPNAARRRAAQTRLAGALEPQSVSSAPPSQSSSRALHGTRLKVTVQSKTAVALAARKERTRPSMPCPSEKARTRPTGSPTA